MIGSHSAGRWASHLIVLRFQSFVPAEAKGPRLGPAGAPEGSLHFFN